MLKYKAKLIEINADIKKYNDNFYNNNDYAYSECANKLEKIVIESISKTSLKENLRWEFDKAKYSSKDDEYLRKVTLQILIAYNDILNFI